ncbi:MAG TPA: AMP-binding protein [Terriglobales bacterium]|nr:AMP-binding protein [Terriglobales bacterium]
MDRASIATFLDDFLRRGKEIAYVERDGYRTVRWSYQQIAETAFRFARELEARQIKKGDYVLLWGPNSAAWVSTFFGCASAGVIVVPMDDAAAPDFAVRVFHQVQAKLLVCARKHQTGSLPSLSFEDLQRTLARHSPDARASTVQPTDVLQVVFTSGTTAEPKGVVITNGNVLSNIAPLETEIEKYLKYERWFHPVRFVNLLPLSHVFGQFLGLFLPRAMGGTVIFQESLKPSEIISTIKRERASVLVAVPRVLQSLKEKIERDFEDQGKLEKFRRRFQESKPKHFLHRSWIFRRVRRQFGWKFWAFICGGAALDSVTEEFWQRLGIAVIQGYGLTETTSLVSVNHPFRVGKGSIGKVLAGREIKLSDDGEILVRGSGVASGYWGEQNLKPISDEEGWYGTGDIGELDAQGNLYFKGRKKDVIVTPAGMNVYPDDLEAALRRQPEIKDCVVVGLPRNGNADPCAVVILRNTTSDLKAVIGRANETLAEYQRMRYWMVWPDEDFPRTSTQKPRRNLIQQAAIAHEDQKAGTPKSMSVLTDLISRIKKRPSQLSTAANIENDLNLSSLERVELMGALEDRYQVDLSEASFASVQTVGDLEKLLHGEVQTKTKYHYPHWTLRWPFSWIRILGQYLLGRPAVFLLGWPRIKGKENLRNTRGPVLIVCNHISHVDVGFVHKALPPRIRHYLATAAGGEVMESLRTPRPTRNIFTRIYDRIRWTMGVLLLNLFPLPKASGFRESFAYAGECVDRGYSVLIFPEGRHTTDGKINSFQSGIGLLANNLKITIVPMRIDGLFELKQAGKHFARPGKIRVTIGKPITFPPDTDPQQIAEQLQKTVEALNQ